MYELTNKASKGIAIVASLVKLRFHFLLQFVSKLAPRLAYLSVMP